MRLLGLFGSRLPAQLGHCPMTTRPAAPPCLRQTFGVRFAPAIGSDRGDKHAAPIARARRRVSKSSIAAAAAASLKQVVLTI